MVRFDVLLKLELSLSIFLDEFRMHSTKLLPLVITVHVDVQGILHKFCPDVDGISFNACLGVRNLDARTQKSKGRLNHIEGVPHIDRC